MNSKLKELLLILANDADDDFDDLFNHSDEDDTEMIAITSATGSISNYEFNCSLNSYTEKAKLKPISNKKKSNNIDYIVKNHSSHYTDQEFKINLSIHKTLVSYLSSKFAKTDHYLKIVDHGKISLSAKSHLHIFLWFLSHKRISYRNVSKHFRISISTVQSILFRVATFINELESSVIKWPTCEEKKNSSDNFKTVTNIPGIIGIIANNVIQTDSPNKKGGVNRLPIQAICNEELKFIHIYIGDSTSIEQNDILEKSEIAEKLETLYDNEFLVGATDYSNVPYIKIPLKSKFELSDDQKEYNKNIEFCINQLNLCVERMKTQFKQLHSLKVKNTKLQYLIIKACFILYNLNLEFEERIALNEHNYFTKLNVELMVKSEVCK